MFTLINRRAVLTGAAYSPALLLALIVSKSNADSALLFDRTVPSCIRWPAWAGEHRAGAAMTPDELRLRYAGNPKRLRYALRRLIRHQKEEISS